MNKSIYFLTGLPRAGNTLLSSILNQNPNIAATANSIVPEILWRLDGIKNSSLFLNFPDNDSLDNVTKNVFNNYYGQWKQNVIIDRGAWGTIPNIKLLEKYFNKKIKFIILVRDIWEVIASLVKWSNENEVKIRSVNKMINNMTLEEKVDCFLNHYTQFVNGVWCIRNIIQSNYQYLIIEYDDICLDTKTVINKIYNFLNIEYFNHRFDNLNQLTLNNINYNDKIIGDNLHTIRTNKIKKNNYKITDIIDHSIMSKYEKQVKEMEIWK